MTETIAYIKESLRDLYPSSEVSSLVRLIMERVCNIQPHHFLFCKDKELPESEKSRIHDIVERLKQMEPIQYILGTADFYSLQFEVDPSVLIPRPETEELVEQVILDNADQKIKILDIGTGSGCIAVTLRKHLKKASVIATDISAEALATARRNAKRNNTTVTFILTFAQKQNMTETIAYIKESLRDLYPSSEVSSLVRLIMERVCNIQPHHFLFCKDKELPESEKSRIHDIVERLKQMEPIQYILGTADFYSLQFEVDPSVLIPRPETEELVEQVILDNADQKIKILDIGTGSGCIAVTLRKHLKKASVIATDISAEALATARRNAKRNNTTVTFIQTDILDPEKAEMDIPFILDVIVSNPPYIKEEEKKDMERNVLDYEPHLALFVPDNDPLLYYWHIAHFGKKKLRRNGHLYFEINAACGNMVVEMLEEEGYKNIELIQDLSGKDRIIKARK